MVWMSRAVLVMLAPVALGHSWLTAPRSHNPNRGRGGEIVGPCDGHRNPGNTAVKAGEVIVAKWPPMGHAGGHNRFALAPKVTANQGKGNAADATALNNGVLSTTCYGGGKCGTCVGGGDPYQSELVIPTNLADGEYTLQWWAYGTGNGLPEYYSCADLTITGGDTSQICAPYVATTANCWFCSGACNPSNFADRIDAQKSGAFCFGAGDSSSPTPTTAPTSASGGGGGVDAVVDESNAACYEEYTVKAGDQLGEIATQFGTTVDAISLATGFEDDAYCAKEFETIQNCPSQCQVKGAVCGADPAQPCVCTGLSSCQRFDIDCIDIGHVIQVPQDQAKCPNPDIALDASSTLRVGVGHTVLLACFLAFLPLS